MVFEQLINTPKTCLITREKIGKKRFKADKKKINRRGFIGHFKQTHPNSKYKYKIKGNIYYSTRGKNIPS